MKIRRLVLAFLILGFVPVLLVPFDAARQDRCTGGSPPCDAVRLTFSMFRPDSSIMRSQRQFRPREEPGTHDGATVITARSPRDARLTRALFASVCGVLFIFFCRIGNVRAHLLLGLLLVLLVLSPV